MSEKSTWRHLREGIKSVVPSHELHLERIENAAGQGTPDVNYVIRGNAGWIELKFIEEFPKRKNTVVRVEHFTTEQRTYLHNYTMAGGRAFVWIQVGREYFLFSGLEAAMFLDYASKSSDDSWRKEDFYKQSIIHFKQGDVDWAKVVEKLCGH